MTIELSEPTRTAGPAIENRTADRAAKRAVPIGVLSWSVPTALMVVLALWRIGRPALWADELATWGAAQLPWSELMRLVGSVDIVVAPYYMFMHFWIVLFGDSDISLRVPSAVAMVATVATTAIFGTRRYGPRVGLVAGLILAVIPSSSRYAQEARPYAMAMFLGVLSTLVLSELMTRARPAKFVEYVGSMAVMGIIHPMTILLALGHAVAVWRTKVVRPWLLCAALGVLPGATLLVFGSTQRAQISWIKLLSWQAVLGVPTALAGSAAVGGALVALSLLAVRMDPENRILVAWAVVPLGLLLAAGFVTPIWVARYALFALPAFALMCGRVVARYSVGSAIAIVVALALLGSTAQLAQRRPAGHRQDSGAVRSIIGSRFQPGDVALYVDNHPSIPWSPRDMVARYLPQEVTPRDALARSTQRQDGELLARKCLPAAQCINKADRVWIIRVDRPADPMSGLDDATANYLRQQYDVVHVWHRALLTVALLDSRQLQR